ncbi:glycosyltransferase [Actinoplanes sp. NPDC051346]|uniref:glycosyltransferase n=1 Tax=Actinoplanes sp. NPDC051346 TaxID=3155048 RepID=UPI00341D944B
MLNRPAVVDPPAVPTLPVGDIRWKRPPRAGLRFLLRASVLAAVGLGGWYLWWRLGTLEGTGVPGAVLLVAEALCWLQLVCTAALIMRARWRAGPPAPPFGTLDVFITVCGEPVEMVENTLLAALRINYPHQTYLLNDGRLAGKPGWQEIDALAARLGVVCFTRTGGARGKAGNLNHALECTDGDFVVTLDADHVAEPDLAEQTIGYLRDEGLAFVCTYQRFALTRSDVLNNRETYFYTVIQPAKERAGGAISCGNGTVYRRAALASIGGFSEWGFVEDLHTSYRLHAAGWRSVYHPRPVSTGTAPETVAEYLSQRQRWAMDSLRLLLRDSPLWRRGLSFSHRLQYLDTTVSYLFAGLQLVFAVSSLSYAVTRFSMLKSPGDAAYLWHAGPYLAALFLFIAVAHRGVVAGLRSMQMTLSSAVMFLSAAVRVLLGRRPGTLISVKYRQRRFSGLLVPPLLLLLAMIGGLALLLRDGRAGISPIGLFWTAFMALLLSGPTTAVTWRPHQSAGLRAGLRLGIATSIAVTLFVPAAAQPSWQGSLVADSQVPAGAFVVPSPPTAREPAPGAPRRLVPPTTGAYFGLSHGDSSVTPAEVLHTYPKDRIHLVQWFQQWRSGEVRLREDWLNSVARSGSVPMIVWEPWARPPGGYSSPDQAAASVDTIASGRYDAYIRSWAKGLAGYKRPVLIKFMHEANGWWYPWSVGLNGNTPRGYVRAWRHVHDIFRAAGATNVSWVWSLNSGYGINRPYSPDKFYPGDDYVDWLGVSGMNWGTAQSWSTWTDAGTIFAGDYKQLRKFGKPIMVSEVATVSQGGDQAAWITKALDTFRKTYPLIRAVVWFNLPYAPPVDFTLDDRSRRALTRALSRPYWRPDPRLVPADARPVVAASPRPS